LSPNERRDRLHGMRTASISEVQRHFRRFLAAVERGEQIVVTRRGKPVVRMLKPGDEPT